ncbi:hypothetical protein ACHAXH_009623 [Discostella pseudostelligera]
MVSQSKSNINLALCFTALLMACSTTQAQLSTLPKRYRSENGKVGKHDNTSSEGGFGKHPSHKQRKTSTAREVRKTNLRQRTRKMSVEELSMSLSLPLDALDMSMPSIDEIDYSMSIDESEFDWMSISLSMSMPSLIDIPEVESVSIDNGSSTGSKLVMASLVAGVSAMLILVAALFAKSANSRKVEESRVTSAS